MYRLAVALLALSLPAAASADSACQTVYATSADVITAGGLGSGPTLLLDGLEIRVDASVTLDLSSECAPAMVLEGLELKAIEPDEIDFTAAEGLNVEGEAQTKEHILLARQPPGLVETTGGLVWAPTSISLREEVISWRPYASVVVADIAFELVDVALDPSEGTPLYATVGGTFQVATGYVLVPDMPACPRCD